ncbi:ATP-grasp domain-containing protein [Agrobacterium tumefaciens]|uniref:carboxylate--amine ligase n=1 Tax=Agrobacterium tumefaciens TaxID=358 RepID=UPI00287E842F|nr:ATP-grasp domain-containing protein [Agrobacterium tumefaciens]MDS7594575.1 ATP-grasp domain-containing protein [Agrobacterium tumefaciens]
MTIPGVVIVGGAHGTLALARSLGALNVRVTYLTHDSPLPGWSRFVHETIRWPGPHDPGAFRFLRDLAERPDLKGSLLIAAGDGEVQLVAENRELLSVCYKIVLPDWTVLRWLCEKPLLYRRATELGVAIPRTYELSSPADADIADIVFPVVLKPNMGGGNTALAKAKVIRAENLEELKLAYLDAASQIGAGNVVVQELIPGGGESQFSYAALWKDGEPVAEFTARRTRQYPVDFGYTSTYVEVVDQPQALEAARKILRSVGHSGLVEVEFKLDRRTDTLKLLDVNPRPWSWFALCSAAGVDLGAMLWRIANDMPQQRSADAQQGVAWSYMVRDLVAAFTLRKRGQTGAATTFPSVRKARCWAAFAFNDPLPGLIDLPLTAWRVLKKRVLPSMRSG